MINGPRKSGTDDFWSKTISPNNIWSTGRQRLADCVEAVTAKYCVRHRSVGQTVFDQISSTECRRPNGCRPNLVDRMSVGQKFFDQTRSVKTRLLFPTKHWWQNFFYPKACGIALFYTYISFLSIGWSLPEWSTHREQTYPARACKSWSALAEQKILFS
jgi:hypothetical protein